MRAVAKVLRAQAGKQALIYFFQAKPNFVSTFKFNRSFNTPPVVTISLRGAVFQNAKSFLVKSSHLESLVSDQLSLATATTLEIKVLNFLLFITSRKRLLDRKQCRNWIIRCYNILSHSWVVQETEISQWDSTAFSSKLTFHRNERFKIRLSLFSINC